MPPTKLSRLLGLLVVHVESTRPVLKCLDVVLLPVQSLIGKDMQHTCTYDCVQWRYSTWFSFSALIPAILFFAWFQTLLLLDFQKLNQVVLWDKIIVRGSKANLDLKNMNLKYPFYDDGNGLKWVYYCNRNFSSTVIHRIVVCLILNCLDI